MVARSSSSPCKVHFCRPEFLLTWIFFFFFFFFLFLLGFFSSSGCPFLRHALVLFVATATRVEEVKPLRRARRGFNGISFVACLSMGDCLHERRGGRKESRFLWDSDFYVMNCPRSRELLSRGRFTSRICYLLRDSLQKVRQLSWELCRLCFCICLRINRDEAPSDKLFIKDTVAVAFLDRLDIHSRIINLFRYKSHLTFLDFFISF